MAIRVMRKGEIVCDKCNKKIADIKASNQCFDVLETEPFTEIICVECSK